MDSLWKSISFRELEEREYLAKENPLRDMFATSSSHVLNQAELEYKESQPSPRWELPVIAPSEVYSDVSMFHLKTVTRISIKESVNQIQENSDVIQTIPLLNPKAL